MDKCVQMLDKELWRLGPDGSGEEKKTRENGGKENREETAKEKKMSRGEIERGARLVWRKGLSPEIGVERL
ncbi:hypothetical protein TNCV_3591341 [Trichonephila clavipes]|nr:hypothetical protein TNCV_3591341 [Trichonephila clavipes]